MRQKADSDKKEAALAEATMSSIEAAAKRQYEKDLAAADAVAKSHGEWVSLCVRACLCNHGVRGINAKFKLGSCFEQAFDEGSKYFYNAAQRYYYSRYDREVPRLLLMPMANGFLPAVPLQPV